MHIEQLMAKNVKTCRPEDTLEVAAGVMWDNDCGCVPVVDQEQRVVGIITDRDVCMAAYTRGVPLSQETVESVMARNVACLRLKDTPLSAELRMQQNRIRRMPVVNDQGKLAGMISLADLATALASRQTYGADGLTWQAIGHTLAAICEPRTPRALELEAAE